MDLSIWITDRGTSRLLAVLIMIGLVQSSIPQAAKGMCIWTSLPTVVDSAGTPNYMSLHFPCCNTNQA